MPDVLLPWKGDLSLTPGGDLAMADGSALTQQQIIRRLYTAVRGVIFHPSYGTGLIHRIGRPATTRVIQAIVQSQIQLEATVAQVPVPVITVTDLGSNPGLFVIGISYTSAITGVAQAISFEVPGWR